MLTLVTSGAKTDRQTVIVESNVYRRRSDEYRRPAQGLLLPAKFPESADRYLRYIRGSSFHQHVAVPALGSPIELELVPELFNPWDANAVATDYQCQRFGYLPAVDALIWHDAVRAANRSGVAVWSSGEVKTYEDDGITYTTATVNVPFNDRMNDLADEFGLGELVQKLLARIDTATRDHFLEAEIWFGISQETVCQIARHAPDFPEFTWPTLPSRAEQAGHGLPGVLVTYLRNRSRREQGARSAERAAERRRAREAREALQDEEKRVRAQERQQAELSRRELVAEIKSLLGDGWTARAVLDHLGVSASLVTSARREMTDLGSGRFNATMAAERRARAGTALRMQVAGRTRREIATEMTVSMETVAALLRDAKFYACPAADPERLALAQDASNARLSGQSKARFRTDRELSNAKSAEAWRDAETLFN